MIKFIKPRNILNNPIKTEFSRERRYISEEKYEEEIKSIENSIDNVLKSLIDIDVNTPETSIEEKEKEFNKMIELMLITYKNLENYNGKLNEIKSSVQEYISDYYNNLKKGIEKNINYEYIKNICINKCLDLINDKSVLLEEDYKNNIQKIISHNGNIYVLYNNGELYKKSKTQENFDDQININKYLKEKNIKFDKIKDIVVDSDDNVSCQIDRIFIEKNLVSSNLYNIEFDKLSLLDNSLESTIKEGTIEENKYKKIVSDDVTNEIYNNSLPLAGIPLDSDYINGSNSTTPYCNREARIKVVTIKKKCTSFSFYYKTNSTSNIIYLYIDGVYNGKYNNDSWTQETISDLSNEEHTITWLLHCEFTNTYSCIDTIKYIDSDGEHDITQDDMTNDIYNNLFPKADIPIDDKYKNGSNSTTPYYNNEKEFKVVTIKKKCTSFSFYYKSYDGFTNDNDIYLYIDGIHKGSYGNISWTQETISDLSNTQHTITWVLYSRNTKYYSCIDTIKYTDTNGEHNISQYDVTNELYNKLLRLADIPLIDIYINGSKSTTPYCNNKVGFKVVTIKKKCTSFSFYYKITNYTYNSIYLYIDGVYKGSYENTSWTQATISDLSNEEHTITWILHSRAEKSYSCIDTIKYIDSDGEHNITTNDVTNEIYDIPLQSADIPIDDTYKNGSNSTTPYYNKEKGIKVVTIKKRCTSFSFYYKLYNSTYNDNDIYLYIDGIYKGSYENTSWTQATISDLSNEEHTITWILYNRTENFYSCIDTIKYIDSDGEHNITTNDVTNKLYNNLFPLADMPLDSKYINGSNSTTPYYNKKSTTKVVTIKKKCTGFSFYYISYNSDIYLYIDGVYKESYQNASWTQVTISDLSNEEHTITWVLYNYNTIYYSCIDTIKYIDQDGEHNITTNDVTNKLYDIPLQSADIPIDDTYKNGSNSTTPYYNNEKGFKVVTIKKRCTSFSFYYKLYNSTYNDNDIYLYIDGIYKERYGSYQWDKATISDLSDTEHTITWLLYNRTENFYSCIDTIKYIDSDGEHNITEDDVTNEIYNNLFPLADIPLDSKYINGSNSTIPYYNKEAGFKVVTIKKKCTGVSFYYKTNSTSNIIYLYIDGVYKGSYDNINSWTKGSFHSLSNEEHTITWLLYSRGNYYPCIDTIKYTNEDIKQELGPIKIFEDECYNIANNQIIMSVRKKCRRISYVSYYNQSTYILFVDGIKNNVHYSGNINLYQCKFTSELLDEKEHVFTWVNLRNHIYDDSDNDNSIFNFEYEDSDGWHPISYKDFINEHKLPLAQKTTNAKYCYNGLSSYYVDKNVGMINIKKKCTSFSFYYKGYIHLYLDGIYKGTYKNTSWTKVSISASELLTEHTITWILYENACIDNIIFSYYHDDCSTPISENDITNEIYNNSFPLAPIPIDDTYKNGSNSTTPYYNNEKGFKVVTIKKRCTSFSFYYKSYKTTSNIIYLYIDGVYKGSYKNTSWTQEIISGLSNEEHAITWVLYSLYGNIYYSCIDTIKYTDSDGEHDIIQDDVSNNVTIPLSEIQLENSEYLYVNSNNYPKIITIKKKCTDISFYYKVYNTYNNIIYLYIDGELKSSSSTANSWIRSGATNLSNEEHTITWVLLPEPEATNTKNMEIKNIKYNIFDEEIFTNNPIFTQRYDEYFKIKYKSIIPRFITFKKECKSISFTCSNKPNTIYLYIDGIYKGSYYNSELKKIELEFSYGKHDFTFVLLGDNNYSIILTNIVCVTQSGTSENILINDINSEFNNNTLPLASIPTSDSYINGEDTTTPYYNNEPGLKVVTIKKKCRLISFYICNKNATNAYMHSAYLYIDGVFKGLYDNTKSWTQETISGLSDTEHTITWVLYENACIDTIKFYDPIFNNIYINNNGPIDIMTIKKKCTSFSFYHKTSEYSKYNKIYLYIDGVYKGLYKNTSWTQEIISDLSNEEHTITWILYSRDDYHSYIDTIKYINSDGEHDIKQDDVTNELYNNSFPLADIPIDSAYKNGSNSTTPYYNNEVGIKVVTIKKKCTGFSFYYKISNYTYDRIYLYIDGIYKRSCGIIGWSQEIISDLSNEEHTITWILLSSDPKYYFCIDTIIFDELINIE